MNKKARHDYEVLDTYEAGMMLTGPEVKSIRLGRAQLKDSFARVTDEEGWIINLTISPYPYADNDEYEPKRTRKLLLKKAELKRLTGKLQQKGVSLVPLKIYEKRNTFKVELGLVRGRKQYEKKEIKKQRDIKREVERQVRGKYKG